MQPTSLPQFKLKEGQQSNTAVNIYACKEGESEEEGSAQTVLEQKQINTISNIRKNSNKIYSKPKKMSDIDEFETEKNYKNKIKKKESQEHNCEVTTEKTKQTNGSGQPEEQRHSQANMFNENSTQKNLVNNQALNEWHINQQNLGTPRSNQYNNYCNQSSNNSNAPSQMNSHFGSQQAIFDIECQHVNHHNCKNCNYSNNQSCQSIQHVETLQEIERRPTNPKYIRSNQTLTTLTTGLNTYPNSHQGHQRAPSFSLASKASNREECCQNNWQSGHFQQTINQQNISNQNDNNTNKDNTYYLSANYQTVLPSNNHSFQNQSNFEQELENDTKQFNQASQNNLDISKSSMNLIQSDRNDKTQVNKFNLAPHQNQNVNYSQHQYQMGSDSSRCNFQFNQEQNQESPLPIKKLPFNYTKDKKLNLNVRNTIAHDQQRNEIPKPNEHQDLENVELNISFSNLSPLDNNLTQQNQNTNQNQNQKKLFNANQILQDTGNQFNANSSHLYQQNKDFKDFPEFDIKSARSQFNLETNNNSEDHHNQNQNYHQTNNLEKSLFNKLQNNITNLKQPQDLPIDTQNLLNPKISENMTTNCALKSNRTNITKELESKQKEYMNSFCCYPSQGETKHDLEKNSSNNSNNNNAYDNDKIIKGNKENTLNTKYNYGEIKQKCQLILSKINEIDPSVAYKKIPEILKQENANCDDFIKLLIQEAQQPIYNSEIDFKVQFQFNSDFFIKSVIVQEIKNLEKNQMLEFAEKKIESSCFYKIFKSFYFQFHRLFLRLIILYMISCLIIFAMYFSYQEIPFLLEIFLVLTFIFQIIFSIIFNYFKCFQSKKNIQYFYFLICFSQIAIISCLQYQDKRTEYQIIQICSIILRVLQIILQLILSFYFYKMNKAAQKFLLCFKIFKLNQ